MKIVKLAGLAAGILFVSASAALAQCDPGEVVIKFSHDVAETHPKGVAANMLAERVNAEMDGKACLEVYPNSTLYDDNKVFEAMLLGDVQLAAPSLSKFEPYTKKYRLFDLPFLFADLGAVNTKTVTVNADYWAKLPDEVKQALREVATAIVSVDNRSPHDVVQAVLRCCA